MTNIELYINRQLCEIVSPENLGIRLNRILLNPTELSLRDSQYSYSITIPSTPVNDSIFNYANVEEVKNKFNHLYMALLYIDGVKIFEGNFKLTEIDESGNYKGNLVVPAKKTVKELFGDIKMNEAGEWPIDIDENVGTESSFAEFISRMNEKDIPECIFPLVLYGLLPKLPKKKEDGSDAYTDKTLWDDTVRFGVTDFPPSINCMQAIREIFVKNKLEIGGTAFEDIRLKKLYMSYHNPTEYQQPWHWRRLGKIQVDGSWTNINNENWSVGTSELETQFYRTQGDSQHMAVNLFQAKNARVTVIEDNGNNVVQVKNKDTGSEIEHTYLTVPVSGLYKVRLKVNIDIIEGLSSGSSNKDLGVRFAYSNSVENVNSLSDIRYEVKVLRTRKTSEFDMSNQVIDGVFYQKNQKGTDDAEEVFDSTFPEYTSCPKFKAFPQYFPQLGQVQLIDQAQNSHFVCGLHWGKNREGIKFFKPNELGYRRRGLSHHPIDVHDTNFSWVMAAKSGFSWDNAAEELNYCAINSEPYHMYGLINENPGEDKEEENLGYKLSDKFAVKVDNMPPSRCDIHTPLKGSGDVSMIVWLDKGERLSVVDVADLGRFNTYHSNAYIKHHVDFSLSVEPYRKDVEWIKVGFDGTGTVGDTMDWNDYNGDVFADNKINLMQFLPSEQKVDDWLNNFCKVFNLQLEQPEDKKFELNRKQSKVVSSASYIDLDSKTSLVRRSNQPLGMPSEFKLGFKINPDEEGYVESEKLTREFQDGGGSIVTGNIDGQVVDQSSSFSYNWFKEITHVDYYYNIWDVWGMHGEPIPPPPDWNPVAEYKTPLQIPVITHKEIWANDLTWDYKHHISKLYTNYSQRFWYKDNVFHHNLVPIMNYVPPRSILNNVKIALVSESLQGENNLVLSYKNVKDSILNRYFTLLVTDDSNYTYVECYLAPDEYERLNGTKLMKLNSDLYYVSAIEGYDPIGVNKTKLKLIRKI